jgi:hypothetical protein
VRYLLLSLALTVASASQASPLDVFGRQSPPETAQRGGEQQTQGQEQPGGQQGRQQQRGPRPYKEVVTERAESKEGVFKVHRIEDRLLFEIPVAQLDKEFIVTTHLAMTPPGGYGGTEAGTRIVRWQKQGDRILLRNVSYAIRAETGEAIRLGVLASTVEPIIMAFNVEAYHDETKAPVIDVTRLFTTDPPEFAVRQMLGGGAPDASRTFLDTFKAFPENVNVRTTYTFGAGSAPPAGLGGRGGGQPSNTAVVHYTMLRLPDQPMVGRLFDSRVGYFTVRFTDYGTDEHRAAERRYITRYRLEKKDPGAKISEPVKPIVYYIGREVPEKWRPYVKQGVEDWQPAFEQAGFKNAIIAMDPPNDPDWDPEDARFSVIRWAPSTTENAMGPHFNDPRSGEIISAHIIMWHNILNLLTRWYFAQASPSDPRAQSLPFPDDLMGELVRYVVAHEVGHTIGLQHNFKANSFYTVAQLRDPEFTKTHGTTASIMDYARFNYVAQPGDGAHLMPVVAPYDKFAIEWGYKPFGAANPQAEKAHLDEIAARQVNNPMLRFGANPNEDPTEQTEALGSDPVEATRLGLLNLERVMTFLVPAATRYGEDYRDLNERFGDVWGQWNRELGHVVPVVGGVVMTNWHAGRGGDVFTPVSRQRQKEAVAFLNERGFHPPMKLLRDDVLNKLQPWGWTDRVLQGQASLLSRLLADTRLTRMIELEARHGAQAYPVRELLSDLRGGIFAELQQTNPKIDVYRRNVQRAYVQNLVSKIENSATEVRALARGELQTLGAELAKAHGRSQDPVTRLHLDDLMLQVQDALAPRRRE